MPVNNHVFRSMEIKAFLLPENKAQPAGKPYCNSGGDVTGGDFEVTSP